jgi:hypothetical protein
LSVSGLSVTDNIITRAPLTQPEEARASGTTNRTTTLLISIASGVLFVLVAVIIIVQYRRASPSDSLETESQTATGNSLSQHRIGETDAIILHQVRPAIDGDISRVSAGPVDRE